MRSIKPTLWNSKMKKTLAFVMKFYNIRAIILFTGCTSSAIASRICGEQSSGSKSAATTKVSATNSVSLIVFYYTFLIPSLHQLSLNFVINELF